MYLSIYHFLSFDKKGVNEEMLLLVTRFFFATNFGACSKCFPTKRLPIMAMKAKSKTRGARHDPLDKQVLNDRHPEHKKPEKPSKVSQ